MVFHGGFHHVVPLCPSVSNISTIGGVIEESHTEGDNLIESHSQCSPEFLLWGLSVEENLGQFHDSVLLTLICARGVYLFWRHGTCTQSSMSTRYADKLTLECGRSRGGCTKLQRHLHHRRRAMLTRRPIFVSKLRGRESTSEEEGGPSRSSTYHAHRGFNGRWTIGSCSIKRKKMMLPQVWRSHKISKPARHPCRRSRFAGITCTSIASSTSGRL